MKLVTGLHIGGLKETIEIGGVDNPVVMSWMKDKNEKIIKVPVIPGSSLKGKIRNLLELKYATISNKKDETGFKIGDNYIKYENEKSQLIPIVFGVGASESKGNENLFVRTRILVRDSYPSTNTLKIWENNEDILHGTEIKAENTINRITSTANPRFLERVPAESIFNVEIVVSIYEGDKEDEIVELILEGIRLLQDNYLGGSGSRGYGKVKFITLTGKEKTETDYENGNDGKEYDLTRFENYNKLVGSR